MRSDERGCDVDAVVWFVSEVSGIGKVFPFEEIGFFLFPSLRNESFWHLCSIQSMMISPR